MKLAENKKAFLCGIGGIGMANVALLLKEFGYDVSGSDNAVYEPAASILSANNISVKSPYAAHNIPLDGTPIIMGNAQSRGQVEVEAALNGDVPMVSFPEFLRRTILEGRHRVVVAGTHGKSTTTACLSHLFRSSNVDCGYLIGALPVGDSGGAHLGSADMPFVIEGDEYDSAFFDKRSKYLHYYPRTLVLGTVEFDHADIFANQEDMLTAFRRLINLLPQSGRLIYHCDCETTVKLAEKAPCEIVAVGTSSKAAWRLNKNAISLSFVDPKGMDRVVPTHLIGAHNKLNALMAIAAAQSWFPQLDNYIDALESFKGIKRRLELLFRNERLIVHDDFAHHPTAISSTLSALRESYPSKHLIAVFEPRSNTMVRNIFQRELTEALALADHAVIGTIHRAERIPEADRLDVSAVLGAINSRGKSAVQVSNIAIPEHLIECVQRQDAVIVFMSNGSFDNAPYRFINLLNSR
jgi:UDP-N-acetylmuramate: L-alanyl-gamma-D-glutamyl-meso-diaminopimelate ligase